MSLEESDYQSPWVLEVKVLERKFNKHITHTQRHMNNAWTGMVILTLCLALYCSFSTWFSQQYGTTFLPLWTSFVGFIQPHFFPYYTSMTTSSRVLHLQHFNFASSQRLVILLSFLVSQKLYNEFLILAISFSILYPIDSFQLKGALHIARWAHSSPPWGKM